MKVNIVTSSKAVNPSFKANSQRPRVYEKSSDIFETTKEKKTFKNKVVGFFKKFKTVLVSTLSSVATGLGVFFVFKHKNDTLKNKNNELLNENNGLLHEKDELVNENNGLLTEKDELINKNNELISQNGKLIRENNELQKQKALLQSKFNNIALTENIKEKVDKKIKEIESRELFYSPLEPPKNEEIEYNRSYYPLDELPKEHKKLLIRHDAKKLDYPEFKRNQAYEFEFPMSKDVRIKKEVVSVVPKDRTLTTISESYADSLLWNNDKIARDLLQNFYDGHGQTLDGVKFEVSPKGGGKYKVRVSGKSFYSPDKAILLGESSKKTNVHAAGNYGEGLKMVVLKLLKENGATDVNIASNNWMVNWKFEVNEFNKKVLAYKLDVIDEIDGNYIEFDTNNKDFIKSLIKTFDRFYHYNNMSFSSPDFENDVLGVNLIDDKQNGKIYIAGQAFEVDGDYELIKGMDIYLKKKPPSVVNGEIIFDPSRDRTSLTADNLKSLAKWTVSKENMSKVEAIKLIHAIEKYWDIGTSTGNIKHQTKAAYFIKGLIEGLRSRYDLNVKFPEKCVADYCLASSELKMMYENAGYRICNSYFSSMGMISLDELVKKTRRHKPMQPTNVEKNKILILQDAINLLAPYLKEDKLFSSDELKSKIYVYDKSSSDEDASYETVLGEAIVKNYSSLGFWVDKTYLNKESFSSLLSTALHELTHKYGGDSTSEFSYKLTDVMKKVIKAVNKSPDLAIELKVLDQAWDAQTKKR